jgi:hypothetical protein
MRSASGFSEENANTEAFSASREVQRIYFMQQLISLPRPKLCGLRFRQSPDSRFGFRLMPYEDEQPDAIF